ncbi:MAG TPA: beta-glucosidase BglX [Prolixibacteraceae bacterium]|nr:beta-glucosidase BglX [Prolixibacteraceae bacterium]HPS13076.1 beta-glucosidase BglX [Prolixibacteraceae bacterium]
MKRIPFLILSLIISAIQLSGQNQKMNTFIDGLMNKMTLQEKIGQLNQVAPGGWVVTGAVISNNVEEKIVTGKVGSILNSLNPEVTRHAQELAITKSPNKIPILFGLDIIHGYKTIFPIPLAASCSWDLDLIEKSAQIAASEASATGINWTFSPMVDISRDPRWGRVSEGAGEDPWWGSQVAAAWVKGYQGTNLSDERSILACVKHFGIYGAPEGGRDYNTVDMSRLSMYQNYLPPYKAAIDAGVGSVMTSFNVVDGIPSTGNRWLLTDVLRDQWKFNGFVVTDYCSNNEMSTHGLGNLKTVSALALNAGTDMDMVGEGFLTTLEQSLADGTITENQINQACRRILEAKYKLGLFDDPYRYINPERMKKETFTTENRETAKKLAQRSIVLLKNEDQVLPLKKSGTIALIGPLIDSKNDMLGSWVVAGDRENVSTLKQGLTDTGGSSVQIITAKGSEFTDDPYLINSARNPWEKPAPEDPFKKTPEDLLKEAVAVAEKADVIIAAVGESVAWSGEAASRSDITIPQCQQKLLKALKATGKPVVVVIFSGRPMVLSWENENFNTLVEAWQLGSEGGKALADVLFGDYNPSGKLTMSFPRSVGQIPVYYNYLNTGRPMNPNNRFSSKYLDIPNDPLFPFGYGLSYSTFSYSPVELSNPEPSGNEKITASVTIKNTGKYAGEEVAELYISDPVATISRPLKELMGFKKIMLQPGESKKVTFEISAEELKYFHSNLEYTWDPGEFIISIGTNSSNVQSTKIFWNE